MPLESFQVSQNRHTPHADKGAGGTVSLKLELGFNGVTKSGITVGLHISGPREAVEQMFAAWPIDPTLQSTPPFTLVLDTNLVTTTQQMNQMANEDSDEQGAGTQKKKKASEKGKGAGENQDEEGDGDQGTSQAPPKPSETQDLESIGETIEQLT